MTEPEGVRLLVVMDPIGSIDPTMDSTFAMLLEVQRRGWAVRYSELGDLWIRDGEARGRARPLRVADTQEGWFELGEASEGGPGVVRRHSDA